MKREKEKEEEDRQKATERFRRDMDHFKTIAKREQNKKMTQNELMKQLEKELEEKN